MYAYSQSEAWKDLITSTPALLMDTGRRAGTADIVDFVSFESFVGIFAP